MGESRESLVPAAALPQSSAGILLRMHSLPRGLLGSDNCWGCGAAVLAPTIGPSTGLTIFHTWAVWKTHFMSLLRIMDSQELGMKSTSSESNSAVSDPPFNCSKKPARKPVNLFLLGVFFTAIWTDMLQLFFSLQRKKRVFERCCISSDQLIQ